MLYVNGDNSSLLSSLAQWLRWKGGVHKKNGRKSSPEAAHAVNGHGQW